MVTEWEGDRLLKLTGSAWPLGDRAARRRPRHRLPGATSLRPPGPRLAARRRDDHRNAAAAGPPAGPEGGAASGDRRRRARQLLRGRDAGARRRLRRRAGHGAARSISRCGPSAPERPSAIARRSGRGLRSARSMASERVESVELTEIDSGPDPDGRVRPGRLHRGLDPRPRAGGDGRLRARPWERAGLWSTRRCARPAGACSRRATCCTPPRRPTSAPSTAATWPRASRRTCAVPVIGRRTCG